MAGESLVNIFPRKNENVNNSKMIQCHRGMEKGHAAGAIHLLAHLKSFFPITFFEMDVFQHYPK